jgi:hypothetical protein
LVELEGLLVEEAQRRQEELVVVVVAAAVVRETRIDADIVEEVVVDVVGSILQEVRFLVVVEERY